MQRWNPRTGIFERRGLGADDGRFALLAGRPGGQLLNGGNVGGLSLTLESNPARDADLIWDSAQQWWPSLPDFTPGATQTQRVARFDATLSAAPTGANAHILKVIDITPTITTLSNAPASVQLTFIDVSPTVTMQQTMTPRIVHAGGSYTNTVAQAFAAYILFHAEPLLKSLTNGVPPYAPVFLSNNTVAEYAGATGATLTAGMLGMQDVLTVKASGAGALAANAMASFVSNHIATQTGAGALTIGLRQGFVHAPLGASGLGAGACALDVAFDVNDSAIAAVTTALSLRSIGDLVEMRHHGPALFGAHLFGPSELVHLTGGNIRLEGGSSTGFLDVGEYNGTNDPAAPADNRARVYVRDNGAGKEQVCVRFNTGAVQVLATEP